MSEKIVKVFTKYDKPLQKIFIPHIGDFTGVHLIDASTFEDGSVDLSLKPIVLRPSAIERGLEEVRFITYEEISEEESRCCTVCL